jgi:hypothetical protein
MDNATVSLSLLFLPAVFTTLFMIRSIKGITRAVLNVVPSLAFAALALLLAEPLFSGGLQNTIAATTVWQDLIRAQDLVVGVSALISLLFLWLQRSRGGKEKHHRH